MAHSLSAKKRIRQNKTRRQRNKSVKSSVRTQLKKTLQAVDSGNAEAARTELRRAARLLDKAAGKGIIHANHAARRKARLAAKINRMKAP